MVINVDQVLDNYVKTERLPDSDAIHIERFIVLSKEAGLQRAKSLYLLVPAEIDRYIKDKFGLDVSGDGVDKVCNLSIERSENGPRGVRIVYEFTPRRR